MSSDFGQLLLGQLVGGFKLVARVVGAVIAPPRNAGFLISIAIHNLSFFATRGARKGFHAAIHAFTRS